MSEIRTGIDGGDYAFAGCQGVSPVPLDDIGCGLVDVGRGGVGVVVTDKSAGETGCGGRRAGGVERTRGFDARQVDWLFRFRAVYRELQRQIAQHSLRNGPFRRENVVARRGTGQRFHHREAIALGDTVDIAGYLHKVPVFRESP